jgi:hypothetical protein
VACVVEASNMPCMRDEASNPIEVGLFRADAVVPESDVVRGLGRAGAGAWGDLPRRTSS